MTQQLQTVLEAAHSLSPLEQLELIQELSHSLQQSYPFMLDAAAFWRPRSIEEIAENHPAPVVSDIHALAVDFWPSDESADDIIAFIREQRRADRLRDA
jgi:hypothetical protein